MVTASAKKSVGAGWSIVPVYTGAQPEHKTINYTNCRTQTRAIPVWADIVLLICIICMFLVTFPLMKMTI